MDPDPNYRRLSGADIAALAAALAVHLRVGSAGPLMTSHEVAEYLKVSQRTLDKLVSSGELPVARVTPGRRGRRFTRTGVDDFVRRHTKAA